MADDGKSAQEENTDKVEEVNVMKQQEAMLKKKYPNMMLGGKKGGAARLGRLKGGGGKVSE